MARGQTIQTISRALEAIQVASDDCVKLGGEKPLAQMLCWQLQKLLERDRHWRRIPNREGALFLAQQILPLISADE